MKPWSTVPEIEKLKGFTVRISIVLNPDYPDEMSPLFTPDVKHFRRHVITHIDWSRCDWKCPDIYSLLREQAGNQVRFHYGADGKSKN